MVDSAFLLERLGFSRTERLLVLHADDIGMCEASVAALRQISACAVVPSISAMVPCGWFPAVAQLCRAQAGLDLGVHLTLTSEWSSYRWGPVLGRKAQALCDADGYFLSALPRAWPATAVFAAYRELRAQIERAQCMGVELTHIDSHMFAIMHPPLVSLYAWLSRKYQLPCVLLPLSGPSSYRALLAQRTVFCFDGWAQLPLDDARDRLSVAERLIEALPVGISFLISHPAADTPELRAITPDWPARVADYRLYLDERWPRVLERAGVKLIGMRAIRRALFELPSSIGARPSWPAAFRSRSTERKLERLLFAERRASAPEGATRRAR